MLIDNKYILTAAHVVNDYQQTINKFINLKSTNYQDLSYVKQGLINNTFLCKYRIVKVHISQSYATHHVDINSSLKPQTDQHIQALAKMKNS